MPRRASDEYASTAAGPIEVFSAAGTMWSDVSEARFRVSTASIDGVLSAELGLRGGKALRNVHGDAARPVACELCSRAMDTDLSKVMALEGRSLRVIAGVGWDEGVAGHEVVPALEQSSEGFALKHGEPAVTQDLQHESRFDYPAFPKRHGVKAILNVVIPGGERSPLTDSFRSTARRSVTSTRKFLQGYANA